MSGRRQRQLAGACYDLYAPVKDVSRPRGEWNAVRVVADGNQIQHWLVKLLDYELGSADWNGRVSFVGKNSRRITQSALRSPR